MSLFPLLPRLEGRRVEVVGGSAVAANAGHELRHLASHPIYERFAGESRKGPSRQGAA